MAASAIVKSKIHISNFFAKAIDKDAGFDTVPGSGLLK
jgi:hypothetical protein